METTTNIQLKSGCVQCLGSLAKYSKDHCKAVQEFDILKSLLNMYKEHIPNDVNLRQMLDKYSKKKEAGRKMNGSIRLGITGEVKTKMVKSLEAFHEVLETAIQQLIRNSMDVDSLLSYLMHPQKEKISLNLCLKQLYKTLNSDVQAKKSFAKKRGLEYVMMVSSDDKNVESNVKKMANEVLGLYPDDLVKLYKPNYPNLLLKKLDDFQTIE
jgi:hypothetical protein